MDKDSQVVINELLDKIRRQAEELHDKDEVLHRKNLELDALHMIWCSGNCEKGVHRWTEGELTQEMAQFVLGYLHRFLTKYSNLRKPGNTSNYLTRQMLSAKIWAAKDDELPEIESILEDLKSK